MLLLRLGLPVSLLSPEDHTLFQPLCLLIGASFALILSSAEWQSKMSVCHRYQIHFSLQLHLFNPVLVNAVTSLTLSKSASTNHPHTISVVKSLVICALVNPVLQDHAVTTTMGVADA